MKPIGAVAATQVGISAGTIYAAGLISGVIWLILGLTGAARRVAALLARPVAVGIIPGLGIRVPGGSCDRLFAEARLDASLMPLRQR